MLWQKTLGTPVASEAPTVTLDNTFVDTATSTSFSFNYGSSLSAGTFAVVVVTARAASGAAGSWSSVTDSAGNTYSLAVQGRQSNNLTYNAVFFCVLTNAVTSATTVTATSASTNSTFGRHGAIFTVSGVSAVENTINTPMTGGLISISSTTVSGKGMAIHVISTGSTSAPTVSSVSADFVLQVQSPRSLCSQYIATSVFDKTPGASVANSFDLSVSANYANMMAIFE